MVLGVAGVVRVSDAIWAFRNHGARVTSRQS
jgi:hypothetical protein